MYTQSRYIIDTIKSFKDKETEKIYHQGFCKRIPQDIAEVALRKLMMIDAVETLSDLKAPPENHLELLHGDHEGQWSIWINNQWRIVFIPILGGRDYEDVEIVDDH